MSDAAETDALVRQTRRLETACSIIQELHGSLSLERIVTGIVENLVEVGGFAGAQILLDATVDNLQLRHAASAGSVAANDDLTLHTSVFIRGFQIGTLITHYESVGAREEHSELLEFILPTLFMAIDHAVSFAEVLDYRATLEQKVADRTAELVHAHAQLSRTVEQLQEARAVRDRFFANINHEIRTPLTLIQLAVDRVERSGETMSELTRAKLDEITSSTRRLLHLVNSLLMLAAGGEGKLQIRPAVSDIAVCLERLVRSWQTAAERAGLRLAYIGPESCPGCLDETALETIVGNLVSNAVKFTPVDGSIRVTLDAGEHDVTVTVRDTGMGIDDEFEQRMFGRFERSTDAANRGVRGSGIGLSLTKELVELQRGSIDVIRHEDPRGTSFAVRLPRHQAVTAILQEAHFPRPQLERDVVPAAAVAVGAPVPMHQEATILLAEDDPTLQRHMLEILSERYYVVPASNGREALELAGKLMPDVLVTDLEMPEMNGIELTRRFLELQGTALSPVLIVSAHAGLGERLAGFEAGAVDYVLKPFSAEELLARVRSQLAIRRLALRLHEAQNLTSMGLLSAGLAHELRNPANAIVNALDPLFALLPDAQRKPDAVGRVLYDVMRAAASQMRELCGNILNVGRSGPVAKRPEDLSHLIEKARLVLSAALKKVRVSQQVTVDRPVECAGPMIEQVLVNLLDNAAYAAGDGGSIEIAAWLEQGRVVIEVSDSGPGVPPHLQERIFDPFFTTKPAGAGTGLGLALSRRIALNHNGDLRLVRRGELCAFRLELPVTTRA